MELSAIYHRTESEYAYLYKDKTMHIRIRTKKDDIESINLHYGDPFIFIEDRYEDSKEMSKVTSDALFDYWQAEVSVGYARLQYLFELKDKQGQSILYGDKGCVENTLENLHYEGNGFYIYDDNKEILARLEYKRNGNTLIFDHTVVSDKLKGQGIAGKLLDVAVDYARKNNFKVHPVCSYVVKKFESGNYDDIKI